MVVMTASYSCVKCLYVYFTQTILKRLNIIKLTFHECIFIAVYRKSQVIKNVQFHSHTKRNTALFRVKNKETC